MINIQRVMISILIVYLSGPSELLAQRTFEFNRQGSDCHMHFVCFAQNNEYNNLKRPFVFILGKPGQTPMESFEKDTLKNLPLFFEYEFVYIPNEGGSIRDRLYCLDALASYVTANFKYGKTNLFLAVYDSKVNTSDISMFGLNRLFANVMVYPSDVDSTTVLPTASITSAFKETSMKYVNENESEEEEDDKYGTFYVDETVESSDEDIAETPKKTFFGSPTTYNYTLTGIVRDKSTGEAMSFATVHIKGSSVGTTTNADGYFTLLKVPTDTSVVIVQYIGYGTTEFYLSPNMPKKGLIIQIRPSVNNLKAVNVISSREDVVLIKNDDVSVVKMTPKKLEQLPNIGERDIMRSFQLMPGVSASNESSSGLYVRGGTPDQNLVLYDGFTVYQVDHLYGFFSAFNSNALKDVQLYKGGFESRFGGRLSSVTELTGKDGNANKFNLGGDISLLSVNLFAEIPIGQKFTSIVSFRKSYKGFLYNKIFDNFNTETKNNTPAPKGPGGMSTQNVKATSYFYDLNAKLTYKLSEKDLISLSIFNGTDKLDNSTSFSAPGFGSSGGGGDFSNSSTDLTKYGNVGMSLKYSKKWSDKLYGNTVLSYSNYFSDRDRSMERTVTDSAGDSQTNKNGIFEKNNLKDFSLKSDYTYDLFNISQLQFGIYGTYYDIKYSYAQSDTSTVLDKANKAVLAGSYIQNRFKFLKGKLQFVPGIRTTYFETTNKYYTEPRASFSWNITDKISIKGATGKYYQFVNRVTREDILNGSKDFWLLSDKSNVPVSSAIHYIAGASYENKNYLFSIETYYKELKNLTEYSLRFNANPFGVSYDENFFNGYGFSKGIEFLVQRKIGKLNGWISYTLGEAKNHFDVYSDTYYPANQDVTHEFKAVGLYEWRRWSFSATWIFATGRPYTAPSGAYTVELLDGSTKDYFTVTAKNGLRLPNYHRGDISANFKLLKGMKGDRKRREIGAIGFSVFNIYNRTNVWYKQYTIENNEILETNVNYFGITPNITLSLKLR